MISSTDSSVPVRGTQSFVRTLSATWGRPALTAVEVLWRWVYGIPALWLVFVQARKVLLATTAGTLDPARLGLDKALRSDPVGALTADPLGAASKLSGAVAVVLPAALHVAIWAAPLLVLAWCVFSALGRTAVLRRADPHLHSRPLTLMGLGAIRVTALAGLFALWFRMLTWNSRITVAGPIAAGQEPDLVLYCAITIVVSLGLFVVWSMVSWWFSVAPLLAMLGNLGVVESLRRAGSLGTLKAKLVEVNLVMGIVKIALIVLAMVFSATPLPFESVTTREFLAWWWAGVTVVYLLASDFFHVARLLAYLSLWRALGDDDKG